MSNGGQQVDPGVLRRAAEGVREAPREKVLPKATALASPPIEPADFGIRHRAAHQQFVAGMHQLSECAKSYVLASDGYAGKLSGAGDQYQAGDQRAAKDVPAGGGA